MTANKQAYTEAYERALHGKTRPLLERILGIFTDDQYTRQSREQGERDGMAARASAAPSMESPPPA